MKSRASFLSVVVVTVLVGSLVPACRSDLHQAGGGSNGGGGDSSLGGSAPSGGAGGGVPGSSGGNAGSAGASGTGGSVATGSGGVAGTGGSSGGVGGRTSASGGAGGTTMSGGGGNGGGSPGGQTGIVCTGMTKACNGGCVPNATCCGGCTGNTPVCSNGTCVARSGGDTCVAGTECATGVCADGICCNVACGGQCEACNSASAKGTCVAVTTPRTACTGTGTCAGHCDGSNRAACVYPATTVSCGAAASCASSNATTAALCNGAGVCTAPTSMACTYGCRTDAPTCDTTCPSGQALCGGSCVDVLSTAAHCGNSCTACQGTTAKCLSGSCVQCVTGNDCSTGQVCTINHACQCRPPSPTNAILNPGFDPSLGGGFGNWTPSTTYATTFSTDDADGCSGSGSAHVAFAAMGMNKDFGKFSQCVPLSSGTTYYFGYKFKQDDGDTNVCELWFYTDLLCAGSPINTDAVQLPSGLSGAVTAWTATSTQISTPAGTGRAQITCRMLFGAGSGAFDQIYLNSAANSY